MLSCLAAVALAASFSSNGRAADKKSGITIIDQTKPPASEGKIDAKYTAEGLKDAFRELCKKLGYRIVRLEVDQSQFPFVLHGVLAGRCDYREIRDTVKQIPGYVYVGSVTSSTRDGSTCFALNMTPPESSRGESRGMMDRMKELAYQWR
jgi:hypothetical protein